VVFVDAFDDAALIDERAARYCGRHRDGLSGREIVVAGFLLGCGPWRVGV
jgi:hypothetical protein